MDFRESFYSIIGDTSSAGAEEIRRLNTQMLQQAFPDDEEMREKLQPTYNPGCKRIIISDDYYPTLALPHVSLITSKITHITPTGIQTSDDNLENPQKPYDLIILATGFETLDFLHPISLTGHNGTALSSIWSNGAKALYGITCPQIPNFAMLYGPNTNLGHNSIILMIEAQSRYINSLISPILAARKSLKSLSLRPKDSRVEQFNRELQTRLSTSAFADPGCQSWYKNSEGLITNNWSGNVVEYQEMLATVQWSDFEIEGDGKEVLRGEKEVRIGRVKEESVVGSGVLGMMGLVSVTTAVLAAGWLVRGGGRGLGGLRVR